MRERPEGDTHLDQFRVRWRCFSVAVIVLVHIVGMLLFRRKFGEAQVSRTTSVGFLSSRVAMKLQ